MIIRYSLSSIGYLLDMSWTSNSLMKSLPLTLRSTRSAWSEENSTPDPLYLDIRITKGRYVFYLSIFFSFLRIELLPLAHFVIDIIYSRLHFFIAKVIMNISEDRDGSMLYLATKCELDRYTNNGDIWSNNWIDTQTHTHTHTHTHLHRLNLILWYIGYRIE